MYLKFLFAAVSIGVLLRFAPLRDIAAVLGNANPLWLVAGIALQFLVRAVATFRMKVVASNQGLSLSRTQLFRILLASQYYSLLLPGVLGSGALWIKYLQHGAGKAAAVAVVVFNRAVTIGMTVALGLCAWLLDRPPAAPGVAPFVISSIAAVVAVLVLLPASARRRDEPGPDAPRIVLGLRRLLGRFVLFRTLSRSDKLIVVTSASLEAGLSAVVIGCFATAIGADVGLLAAIWVRAVLLTVSMAPITVAGLGVREASLVGCGAILGVSPAQAMAWSFAILLGTLVVASVGGLFEANAASGRVAGCMEESGPAGSDGRVDP